MTRATADLDVTTRERGEGFEKEFRARREHGWGATPASKGTLRKNPDAPDRVAFTAALKPGRLHDPGLTRPQYVMHPYRVTLLFLGREWAGLAVEVSDPEIEPHDHTRRDVDRELITLSAYFGFGQLQPVEPIDFEYQIAQKIHAVTDPDYVRAHDLVDLQLLWEVNPDLPAVREFCMRTFEFRPSQVWPPLPPRPMDRNHGRVRELLEVAPRRSCFARTRTSEGALYSSKSSLVSTRQLCLCAPFSERCIS